MKRLLCSSYVLLSFVVLFDPKVSQQRWAKATIDVDVSAILDSLQAGYDKRVRPNYGGPSVDVGVSMYLLSISKMSEVEMDFTADFYFRQTWQDPRLSFRARPGLESLSVGSEFLQKIWVPDTFFVNEKKSYFHTATTSNEFLRIMANGDVLRSIRLTITASCPMDLQYFPMDHQLCHIEIESFGYTMSDIRYRWRDGPGSVGVSSDVSLPQFKVLGHRQRTHEISLSTGNYSRLICEIQFVRSMGYYMIQMYIPSSLIVVISWVSFWINRNAAPARVSLGVTTVLTMTTLMSSTNAALPKISYIKSIDVYLGTCFVMVFASLLEYATVGYVDKRIQLRKRRFDQAQKAAEEKKNSALLDAVKTHDGDHAPKPKPTDHPNGWRAPASTATLPPPFRVPYQERGDPRNWPPHHMAHQHDGRYNLHDPTKGQTMKGAPSASSRSCASEEEKIGRVSAPPSVAGAPGGGAGGPAGPPKDPPSLPQHIQNIFGVTPSDIDKYSRILFPVCFVCFNLSYWIIYLHISNVLPDDLVLLKEE